MMTEKYKLVKKYYDAGLWDEARVRKAVAKNWINAEQFKKITGKGLLGE